ncbi:MAG: hypothetical protein KIT54_10885 [Phycisphaeraceae bacterium]|nr:hypothetical protein [Phycisphaeraceae bacterium]
MKAQDFERWRTRPASEGAWTRGRLRAFHALETAFHALETAFHAPSTAFHAPWNAVIALWNAVDAPWNAVIALWNAVIALWNAVDALWKPVDAPWTARHGAPNAVRDISYKIGRTGRIPSHSKKAGTVTGASEHASTVALCGTLRTADRSAGRTPDGRFRAVADSIMLEGENVVAGRAGRAGQEVGVGLQGAPACLRDGWDVIRVEA